MDKASTKTTKSKLDLQIDSATKELKSKGGICFAIRKGNSVDYMHIPTDPSQKFRYFVNTSHMTNAERQDIYRRKNEIKLLVSSVKVAKVSDEEKEIIARAIDKKTIKKLAVAEGLIK